MIKGKTLIELTDVNTGKVERFEDENIITEAAQLYYDGVLSLFRFYELDYTGTKRMPIWNSVFGGIKLFENTIEENPSNFQMPSVGVNKVVGFASCDASDGKDPRRGSRNLHETIAIENGVQIVWDFATSEANGTISCVCLTSGYSGENSYFNMNNIGYESNTYGGLSGKYPAKNIFHKSGNCSSYPNWDEYEQCIVTFDPSKLMIKYKIPLEDLALDESFGILKKIGEPVTYTSINELASYGKVHPDYYYYIVSEKGSSSVKLTIHKYDKLTLEKTDQILTLPLITTDYTASFGTIIDGFIYLKKDASTVYKIDMNNPSNVTEVNFEGGALTNYLYKLPNGDFTSGNVVFDPVTGSYYVTQSREGTFDGYKVGEAFLVKFFRVPSYSYSNDYMALCLNDAMLHSINNLDTPVTKTADKTMKITYTLTYN